MTEIEYSRASEATTLCKACGLCCTGHLFSWVRLKATELAPLEKLGMQVVRDDPRQRGFLQPCPMWDGDCKIYESPQYPRGCESYKCKLFRELLDESVELDKALRVVKHARAKIRSVENLLPPSAQASFRERLVERIEHLGTLSSLDPVEADFRSQADELLKLLDRRFGVNDFLAAAVTPQV